MFFTTYEPPKQCVYPCHHVGCTLMEGRKKEGKKIEDHFDIHAVRPLLSHFYIIIIKSSLVVVEWVALIRFLFGMWHYESTLDFAFLV